MAALFVVEYGLREAYTPGAIKPTSGQFKVGDVIREVT
jgi:hypothetical protein